MTKEQQEACDEYCEKHCTSDCNHTKDCPHEEQFMELNNIEE